ERIDAPDTEAETGPAPLEEKTGSMERQPSVATSKDVGQGDAAAGGGLPADVERSSSGSADRAMPSSSETSLAKTDCAIALPKSEVGDLPEAGKSSEPATTSSLGEGIASTTRGKSRQQGSAARKAEATGDGGPAGTEVVQLDAGKASRARRDRARS